MALHLTSKFNVFRRLVDINSTQSCPLHQLAAKLTATQPETSSCPAPGAPLLNCVSPISPAVIGGGWSLLTVRHKIRNHFPKPREHKRLKFTWEERIKTEGGRSILMRRIVKGRWYITHPPSMLPHWPHKPF